MDFGFWKGKKVFITGHTGFKGSWLTLWLKELGAEITGYSLDIPTKPSLFECLDLEKNIQHILGDVRDYTLLKKALLEAQPDIVFHMAAQPLVRKSYHEPIETFAVNVMGTVHLLDAIRFSTSTKATVIVTTDKCYENKEWYWPYREDEPMGGYDPYSSSKGCAELVTSAYRRSYFGKPTASEGCQVGSGRAGNVIGGGDFAEDRIIPDIYRSFASGTSLQIRNPASVRPWQHVLEPLSGYLLLAERLYKEGQSFAEGWNFGPRTEDSLTVREIVTAFTNHWPGKRPTIDFGTPSNLHEASLLQLDINKARQKLNWVPVLPVEKGIQWTVEWYSHYNATEPTAIADLTRKQIQEYQELRAYRHP